MNRLFILFFLIFASCSKSSFKKLPEGPISHQLIVLARVDKGIKVRGFSGATPAETPIMCTIGEDGKTTKSNADGSFILDLVTANDAKFAELIFEVSGREYHASYQVKDLVQGLDKIAKEPFDTGSKIHSLSFADEKALLLDSDAAEVKIFHLTPEWNLENSSTIILNPDSKVTLAPRMVEGVKIHALVPLFFTHELLLLDITKNQILSKTRLLNADKKPFMFKNNPPLMVNEAIDADGTGAKKEIVNSFARNAESVFALDDEHFLASFINNYQFSSDDNKSVMGPGIVALVSIQKDQIVSQDIKILEFKNPMHFFRQDAKNIWITCAGEWEKAGDIYKSTEAGLVRLAINDTKTGFDIAQSIPLKDFSPGMPTFINGKIIIPHSQQNEIAVIDHTAVEVTKADIKSAKFHRPFSFSFATPWHDDIVMLGDDKGALVAYSLREEFFPFPFIAPIRIDPEATIAPPRIHSLFFRHDVLEKSLKDLPAGFTAWALSSTQSRIFPLDFLAIFGP